MLPARWHDELIATESIRPAHRTRRRVWRPALHAKPL